MPKNIMDEEDIVFSEFKLKPEILSNKIEKLSDKKNIANKNKKQKKEKIKSYEVSGSFKVDENGKIKQQSKSINSIKKSRDNSTYTVSFIVKSK